MNATCTRSRPVLLAALAAWLAASAEVTFTLGPEESLPRRWKVPCSAQYLEDPSVKRQKGCSPLPGGACDRVVVDAFLTPQEARSLPSLYRGSAEPLSMTHTPKIASIVRQARLLAVHPDKKYITTSSTNPEASLLVALAVTRVWV